MPTCSPCSTEASHSAASRQWRLGFSGVPVALGTADPSAPSPSRPAVFDDSIDRSARRVIEPYAPAYFVIDRNHDIVRFSGADAGQYLEPTAGAASLNLFSILRRTLRPDVRAAVVSATTERRGLVQDIAASGLDGQSRPLSLIVEPIEAGLFVVAFRDACRGRRNGSARGRGRNRIGHGAGTACRQGATSGRHQRTRNLHGGGQVRDGGNAIRQRGTAVVQRGARNLQGGNAVDQRGAADR